MPPRLAAGLALAGAWVAFYARMIFSPQVPFERDLMMTVIPLRQFFRDELAAGRFPQWFPYEMLGVPFAGSVVASPFHPQTLLLALLSPSVAVKWSLLLAVLFGLIGAYRLVRQMGTGRVAAVAGAYAFGFSGFVSSLYNNPPFLIPLATAPWMLAAAHRIGSRQRRRDVAALGWWWALLFLGGDPQLTIECGLMGLGLVLLAGPSWRNALRFAAGGALAAAIASAELLPALALGQESNRVFYKPNFALGHTWALHPLRLGELLVPHFIPDAFRTPVAHAVERMGSFFIETLFAGGAALSLAALGAGRRSRYALAGILSVVVGLWLALGAYGHLLLWVWRAVPLFVKFRYPEKFAALFALAMIGLVASGVEALVRHPKRAAIVTGTIGVALLLLCLFAGHAAFADGVLSVSGFHSNFNASLSEDLRRVWPGAIAQTAFAVLLLTAVALAVPRQPRAVLLIPVLIFGELWLGNAGLPWLASVGAVEEIPPFARTIIARTPPGEPTPRVLPLIRQQLPAGWPVDDLVRERNASLVSDDSGRVRITPMDYNSSAELWRVMRTLLGSHRPDPAVWYPRLNVCYRVAPESQTRPGDRIIEHDHDLVLLQQDCLPRAYLAKAIPVASAKEAQQRVREGMPPDTVVWEGGPALSQAPAGSVHWIEALPDELKLDVQATVSSALVVSDAFARGWTATIDGLPAPIYATDAFSRGLAIRPGRHTVEMVYRAQGLLAGAALSLVGLIVALALAAADRRERKLLSLESASGAEGRRGTR